MANKWLTHVKQVKANNPGMKFKDVLKLAAKGYKKQAGGDPNAPTQEQGAAGQQGGVAEVQSVQGLAGDKQHQNGGGNQTDDHHQDDAADAQSGGKKSRKNRRNKKGGNKSRKNRNNKKSRKNRKQRKH